MRPIKTDLARQTLLVHTGTLGMRERRTLILCDGQRDLAELVRLLGQDAPLLVQRLMHDGYLTATLSRPEARSAVERIVAPVTPAPTGPRRSLVAAKVYLSGMLELQRDDGARAHRERLQSRLDDDAMLEVLVEALRFLESRMATTLAARIRARLLEALPEDKAPRLQDLLDAEQEAAVR